jgi:hypothetical protein
MKTKIDWFKHIVILSSLLALPALGFAQDVHPEKKNVKPPKKEYYSFVGDHFPNQVFFGDTHVHTSMKSIIHLAYSCLALTQDRAYTSPIWHTP